LGEKHRAPPAELAKIHEAAISILFRSLFALFAECRSLEPIPGADFFSKAAEDQPQETLSLIRPDFNSQDRLVVRSLDARYLGSIYESLLNHELRFATTPPQIELAPNASARKASGSYYTPPTIVEHLVANTIGPVLDRVLDVLLHRIRHSGALPSRGYRDFVARLFDLKVVDPAMGCGHFLVEVVHFIVGRICEFLRDSPEGSVDSARLRRALLRSLRSKEESADFGTLGVSELIRLHVLEQCIYGVDSDPFAVELARATLWLDAGVRGARLERLNVHLRLGDALVGRVRSGHTQRSETTTRRHFDWDIEFSDVFRPNDDSQEDARGFDCVVGNPPYVRIQNLDGSLVDYLKSSFKTAVGKFDLCVPFLERGVTLLKNDGRLGMIVPNKLLTSHYGTAFRDFAARHRLVRQIVDFECEQVFPGASTYCCLLFLGCEASDSVTLARGAVESPMIRETVRVPSEMLGAASWSIKARDVSNAVTGEPLKSVCRAIFQGLITGADRLLIGRRDGNRIRLGDDIVKFDPLIFRPVLKGSDVRRFSLRFSEHYVLSPYGPVDTRTELMSEAHLAAHHPDAYRYLKRHRNQLEGRGSATMVYPAWYAHWCPRSIARFEASKIVTRVLASRASFALDRQGTYAFVGGGNAGVYGIIPTFADEDRLWLLLAILNSRAFDAQLQSRSSHFRGAYFSYARRFIENVTIPRIATVDLANESVRRVIHLARERAESPSECHNRLEVELDGAVDELYRCGIR
jgi:Eco57I restriction-modification methylase/TaqI-like C-terminal specificity domain